MQSIIIPVDFTERSRMAIDYAAKVFASCTARFILIHAYSTVSTREFLISIDDIIEKDIRMKLEMEGAYLKEKLNAENPEIVYFCEKNDIISSIISAGSKYTADLIVMGSNSEVSWSDIAFKEEGLTLNIIKQVPYPTLVVPFLKGNTAPKNILFATMIDGIKNSDEIAALIELVKDCSAHLDILNVGSNKAASKRLDVKLRKTVSGFFGGVDYKLHTMLDTDPFQAIGQFSDEHHNDLICIMYRKHNILDSLLKPSVSRKIISHMDKPILALKHI